MILKPIISTSFCSQASEPQADTSWSLVSYLPGLGGCGMWWAMGGAGRGWLVGENVGIWSYSAGFSQESIRIFICRN